MSTRATASGGSIRVTGRVLSDTGPSRRRSAISSRSAPRHHARARAALAARLPRTVVDAELGQAGVPAEQPHQQLGRDRRAVGLQLELVEQVAADELERAVDVAHRQAEHAVHEAVPERPGDDPPVWVVAVDAAADDHVMVARERDERLELGEVELQVGVGQQHPRLAGGRDARSQRGAVPAVGRMHDDADRRVGGGERGGDGERPVAAAVVDDDHLVRERMRAPGLGGHPDGRREVRRLVVAGKDDGHAREGGSGGSGEHCGHASRLPGPGLPGVAHV